MSNWPGLTVCSRALGEARMDSVKAKAKRAAKQSVEALNSKALMEFPRRAVNEGKGSSLLEGRPLTARVRTVQLQLVALLSKRDLGTVLQVIRHHAMMRVLDDWHLVN